MVYMSVKYMSQGIEFLNIVVSKEECSFTSFPAEVGNPNYDAFLTQVDLTDEKVHALPTDEWFEV